MTTFLGDPRQCELVPPRRPPPDMGVRASHSTSTRTSSSTRVGSTTCGIRSTPPSARAESDFDLTWRPNREGSEAVRALHSFPQTAVQAVRGMERAGLEPATPSLQIRLNAGLGGSRIVNCKRTSRNPPRFRSELVSARRRDLTRSDMRAFEPATARGSSLCGSCLGLGLGLDDVGLICGGGGFDEPRPRPQRGDEDAEERPRSPTRRPPPGSRRAAPAAIRRHRVGVVHGRRDGQHERAAELERRVHEAAREPLLLGATPFVAAMLSGP